jgi:glucose/mannose transport system substrate-binding protein
MANGDAAFHINGDWVAGLLQETNNLTPEEDFYWAAAPDTQGEFMMISDSFGLTKGAPNPINCVEFLRLAGSKEGSDIFNPKKGSISPRLDSDMSEYNAYQKWATEEWRESTIVGSLVHGVVAPEDFMNDFATVMETFYSQRNPMQASRACQELAKQAGIGQ